MISAINLLTLLTSVDATQIALALLVLTPKVAKASTATVMHQLREGLLKTSPWNYLV